MVTEAELDTYISANTLYLKDLFDGVQTQTWTPRYAAGDAVGHAIVQRKARGSLGTPTIVSASDSLGTIGWAGYDGSAYREAAQIKAFVDGTPGASDMPGALSFLTSADGGITLTEQLRISNSGAVTTYQSLTLEGDASRHLDVDVASSIGGAPSVTMTRRRGTQASSTDVSNGDVLGSLAFYGWAGGTEVEGAAIRAQVSGTPGASDLPTRLSIGVTTDGDSGITERIGIEQNGVVGITGTMTLSDASAPGTPASGLGAIWYDDAMGALKVKTDSGVTRQMLHAGARVYHNAAQSIANATETTLAFNSERYDSDAFHDTATNNSRLTIPTGMGGKYLIIANIEWAVAADALNRYVRLLVNGGTYIAAVDGQNANTLSFATAQQVMAVYDLAAGDYVEVRVRQDSGGAININSTANFSPEFSITAVG